MPDDLKNRYRKGLKPLDEVPDNQQAALKRHKRAKKAAETRQTDEEEDGEE